MVHKFKDITKCYRNSERQTDRQTETYMSLGYLVGHSEMFGVGLFHTFFPLLSRHFQLTQTIRYADWPHCCQTFLFPKFYIQNRCVTVLGDSSLPVFLPTGF